MTKASSAVEVDWAFAYRAVLTRPSPAHPFRSVARPSDRNAVEALAALSRSLTAPRLGAPGESEPAVATGVIGSTGQLRPGPSVIPAPRSLLRLAEDEATALAEVKHQREAFLRSTDESPASVAVRVHRMQLQSRVLDMIGQSSDVAAAGWHDVSEWLAGTTEPLHGVLYRSAVPPHGLCVALTSTIGLDAVQRGAQVFWQWTGSQLEPCDETDLSRLRGRQGRAVSTSDEMTRRKR